MIQGLLNVWYANFFGSQTHAVLPYSQYLHRFPAYLQQLTMESNGKSVRGDGDAGHHAHRGDLLGRAGHQRPARLLPAHPPGHPADPGRLHRVRRAQPRRSCRRPHRMHDLFMSNLFAQTSALAFGRTADEIAAEGTAADVVPHKVMPGNRPTLDHPRPQAHPVGAGPADRLLRARHVCRGRRSGVSTRSTSGASSWARCWPSSWDRCSPGRRATTGSTPPPPRSWRATRCGAAAPDLDGGRHRRCPTATSRPRA